MMRNLRRFVTGMFFFLSLSACSERDSIVRTAVENTAFVSGAVVGWYCEPHNVYGFRPRDTLFAVNTGEAPHLRFIYPNGEEIELVTDFTSRFHKRLPRGRAQVIVETRFTIFPDTFSVDIQKDTILQLDITYAVLNADNVDLTFYYATPADSLGAEEEWRLIRRFNRALNSSLITPLKIPLDQRQVYVGGRYPFFPLFVWYRLSVASKEYTVFAVSDQGKSLLSLDSTHEFSPVPFYINPSSFCICPAGASNP